MKKQILFLAAIFLVAVSSAKAQSGTTGNLSWAISNDTLTISGTGVMPDYSRHSQWSAPWGSYSFTSLLIEEGVTSIGSDAFYNCVDLFSISLPSSVNKIGEKAFQGCKGLISVEIPNTVTNIGAYTFSNCSNLVSASYNITNSNDNLFIFYDCEKLEELHIGKDVLEIKPSVLGCNNLKTLYYNAANCQEITTSHLNQSVFSQYPKLEKVYIEESTETLPSRAFNACKNLTSVVMSDGITIIGYGAFYNCPMLSSVNLPNSINKINEQAFGICSSLSSVILPNKITSIEYGVFSGCSNLTSITIPNGVTNIGLSAFGGCKSLASIILPENLDSIGRSAFSDCSSLTSIIIPNNVTSIGNSAFSGCEKLTSIILPENLNAIGQAVFSGCASLNNVTLTDNIVNINALTFQGATAINEIIVGEGNGNYSSENGILFNKEKTSLIYYPQGKTGDYIISNTILNIEDYAFSECTGLTSISIPENIVRIGHNAFEKCSSLTSIIVNKRTPPTLGINVFSEVNKSQCSLWTPLSENISLFTSEAQWRDFKEYLFINKGGTTGNLTWLLEEGKLSIKGTGEMPDYYLGNSPWKDYVDLITDVIIESGVSTIGNNAFYNCINLSVVDIAETVNRIGNSAFNNCSTLVSVSIPSNIATIDNSAFYNCINLAEINIPIPNSIVKMGTNVFENTAWYNNQPDGIVYLADILYACKGSMSSNTHLDIEDNIRMISSNAFFNNKYLISINIPESIIIIGESAFKGCSGLTYIIIPNTAESIGSCVFDGCINLESLTFPLEACEITYLGELFHEESSEKSLSGYFRQGSKSPMGTTKTTYYYVPESLKKVYITNGKAVSTTLLANVRNLQELSLANTFMSIANGFLTNTSVSFIELPLNACSYGSFMDIFKQANCTFMGGGKGPCTSVSKIHVTDDAHIPSSFFKNQSMYTDGQTITEVLCPYITGIGSNAFEGTSIKTLHIPSTVTSIGTDVFKGCKSLTDIEVDEENMNYSSENGILYNKNKTELVDVPDGKTGSVKLANSLTKIRLSDFENCVRVGSISIPASTINIENNSFATCSILSSLIVDSSNPNYTSLDGILFNKKKNTLITYPAGKSGTYIIPDNVDSIGNNAFYNCTRLASVEMPDGLVNIGNFAFKGCTALTVVIIPGSINDIKGSPAFEGCRSLQDVYIRAVEPPVCHSYTFSDVDFSSCILHVPAGSKSAYKNAEVWKQFIIAEEGESDISITTGDTTVTIHWDAVEGAEIYTLIVYRDKEHKEIICTLKFDKEGNLLSVDFAKGTKADSFSYTLENLSKGTTYYYTMVAYDNSEEIIDRKSGSFKTTGETLGIPKVNTVSINVYPNPTKGKLTIENKGLPIGEVKVFDISGKKLSTFSSKFSTLEIDISRFSRGVYILHVGEQRIKIVKE